MSGHRFYRTNSVEDPGHEVTVEELAVEFMGTQDYAEWVEHGGRLARWVMTWLTHAHGGTDEDFGAITDRVVAEVLERRRAQA